MEDTAKNRLALFVAGKIADEYSTTIDNIDLDSLSSFAATADTSGHCCGGGYGITGWYMTMRFRTSVVNRWSGTGAGFVEGTHHLEADGDFDLIEFIAGLDAVQIPEPAPAELVPEGYDECPFYEDEGFFEHDLG